MYHKNLLGAYKVTLDLADTHVHNMMVNEYAQW